jgi:hypothetical protein
MADEPASGSQTNGTPAADEDSRDSIVAGLSGMSGAKPAEPTPKQDAKPDAKAEAKPPADDDSDLDELDDAKPDAKAADPDADLDDEDDALGAKDPEMAKRLSVLQRKEQRQRETFERREAEIKARESEVAAKAQAATEATRRLDTLAKRAAAGDISVLAELGFPVGKTDDEAKAHARAMYEWTKDPRNAARIAKDLEYGDKLTATEKRLEELTKKLEERDHAAKVEAYRNDYIAKVLTVAPTVEKAVHVANVVKHNPKRAEREMLVVADWLAQQHGQDPTHKQVVIAYEKQLRQDQRDRGLPLLTAPTAANANAGKKPTVQGAKPAPAAAANDEKPTVEGDPRHRDPEKDEILRELAALRGN